MWRPIPWIFGRLEPFQKVLEEKAFIEAKPPDVFSRMAIGPIDRNRYFRAVIEDQIKVVSADFPFPSQETCLCRNERRVDMSYEGFAASE